MVAFSAVAILAGAAVVAAQQCTNITIPVTVNATNYKINEAYPYNQSQVTNFIARYNTIPQPQAASFENGTFQNQQTYNIGATYCKSTASSNSTNSTRPLQILIHGIGFDRSYWNFTNATSYTIPMLAQGYDTLAIDRLGCGTSSAPDGLQQVQTATHIEVVRNITMAAMNGTLPSVNTSYTEIIHVGHSYGSIISNGLVAKYPSLSSAVVLTGYSSNSTWLPQTLASWSPRFANTNAPGRFGNSSSRPLNNTYLTWFDIYNNQLAFFSYPYYNETVLQMDEATKQPVTYGELITLGGGTVSAANFTGAVHVVTGNDDFIFCGGNCTATGNSSLSSLTQTVELLFPAASNFTNYNPVNTGHAVQLHSNSLNSTLEILSFLKGNSL